MVKNKKICITESWCKGCGICVEFCPANALTMKDNKVFLKIPEKCTSCGLCELRCPDYAIYLEVIDDDGKIDARK
ncbi:ATP-binding protein [Thermoanaerobacterium xylanolyticum]|uniref:ATP-binding protein n=1 Tax=Thermoanaerobacterium xylanolyticum TaxID=29329 RepID=UPI0005A12899|nr:4Fe-4S binding protein [Thermoanaerobacterium xylanolyticum]